MASSTNDGQCKEEGGDVEEGGDRPKFNYADLADEYGYVEYNDSHPVTGWYLDGFGMPPPPAPVTESQKNGASA